MLAYKLKYIHNEDDTLYFYPKRQNINAYPREEDNCGDYFIVFLTYDLNVCDTIIAQNTYLRINKILESTYSILSSLHICGSKYRIYSRKTETATNINIHRTTESMDSNTILEGTDDKGASQLLLNIKYIVTVVDPISSFEICQIT